MKARMSIGKDYDCKYEWGCFCQAGKHGVVFSSDGAYSTAFFEAFPENPKCFLRGEGKWEVEGIVHDPDCKCKAKKEE